MNDIAPFWFILIIIVVLAFGLPLLIDLKNQIVSDIGSSGNIDPGIRGFATLMILFIALIGILRVLKK